MTQIWVNMGSGNNRTNVNMSLVWFCDINMRANLQFVLINFICNLCSEIKLLKLLPRLPGDNDDLSVRPLYQDVYSLYVDGVGQNCCISIADTLATQQARPRSSR